MTRKKHRRDTPSSVTPLPEAAPYEKIQPQNKGQENFVHSIRNNLVTICQGPAGTGKTLLSIAEAVDSYLKGQVSRVVIARPALVALDEDIGHLPGTKEEKLAPFLKPILKQCQKCFPRRKEFDVFKKEGLELVQFSYMRGLTFENSFIILDEAQNCTKGHFDLLIDRAGKGSKIVISGDTQQRDRKNVNDFRRLLNWNHRNVGIVVLTQNDNVRNPSIAAMKKSFWEAMSEEEK